MDLHGFRLRAVGPPLAVAAFSVAALVWFDRVFIPAQQQYFNERNLRTLRTISGQLKAKVDSFDQSIDHAIESFPVPQGQRDLLKKYVKLFAPELEIVKFDPDGADEADVTPGDPPNVRLQRTEGRNYLFLGYKHRKSVPAVTLIARADIEQVAAAYLASRREFDALVLVDVNGSTIAQRSWSGLELTSIQKLRDRGQSIPSGANPETTGVFERLRGTTNLAVVTIGAADYMLYVQPVQLSMMHEAEKGTRQSPEEWTLCGLVRLDRFRAASSKIPTTYWLCFGALLALVCFAIPLLKLRVLSARERIRRIDGVSVGAAVFMMMALATFTALDLYVFGAVVPGAVDDQLQQVAASISRHVGRETRAVDEQMTQFEKPDLWQSRLDYEQEDVQSLDEVRAKLGAAKRATIQLNPEGPKRRSQCVPTWSCREGVLRRLPDIPYPFFKLVVWNDNAGWQRIKWSTAPVVTPFINVGESKLAYFDALKLARRFSASDSTVPTSGVSVVPSPNTGEKLTIFWKALPPTAAVLNDPTTPDLIGRTLATAPVSLTNPVLPKGIQFAVVDPRGMVLFHLDPARSLSENFFRESEENPKLKSLVAGRESGMFSGPYLGRPHRFYVTPLEVEPFGSRNSGQGSRASAPWTLIVFQAAAISETINLGTINLAGTMFTVYALALAVGWAMLTALWPGTFAKWLWPDRTKGPQYRVAAVVSAAIGLACVGALPFMAPATLLSVAVVMVAGAVAAVGQIVGAKGRPSGESPTWVADFFWARASLLFVLAAVPAIICFHVAYAFETDLIARRGQSHLATELGARADRIRAQAQKVAICTEVDSGTQTCDKVGQIVAHRTKATLWDVHVPAVREPEGRAGVSLFASTPLRSFLKRAYRPYNEIAADHLIASDSRAADGLERWRVSVDDAGEETFTNTDTPTGWRLSPAFAPRLPVNSIGLIAVALLGVAYALGRYLLRPLFVLDLEPPVCSIAAAGPDDESNRLIIGRSGVRTIDQWQGHPRVRIFDVRSLSFADEPAGVALATSSSPAQVCSAADYGHGMEERSADWMQSLHMAASHPTTILGVAHLEHRLDDQVFREKMIECLEFAVHRHRAAVWIVSSRDPLEAQSGQPATDRSRWVRLLESFRRESVELEIEHPRVRALEEALMRRDRLSAMVRSLIVAECEVAPELLAIGERLAGRLPIDAPVTSEAVLAEIGGAALHFYEGLWAGCATDERVLLRQLAEEGLVNPNNSSAIRRLLSAGLVRRDRTFRIMNETFRRFVLRAVSPQVISSWEREGVRLPWGTIATTGVTVAFGLAGLLLLTQEQLVDAWISYVPALAPAIPTVWKVLATVQKGGNTEGMA